MREAPPWALQHGDDAYGRWASFAVGGVTQRMRWIAPGTFLQGAAAGEVFWTPQEGPQHAVTLTRAFWLAETPVTQAMWEAVMRKRPSHHPGDARPVEQVNFVDAGRFVAALTKQVRGLRARLPCESEWEYACRAGTTTATWVGDLTWSNAGEPALDAIAWHEGVSEGTTHEVGLKTPNPWGLYDMLGNVAEWCLDAETEYAAATPRAGDGLRADPAAPGASSLRIHRGGHYQSPDFNVRCADRGENQDTPSNTIGVRPARAVATDG